MLGTRSPRRAAARLVLLTLGLLAAASAPPAHAQVTASQVTSPAEGTRLFTAYTAPASSLEKFTVTATVEGTGDVRAGCRAGDSVPNYLSAAVTPSGGIASIEVDKREVVGPCRLVVVPDGALPADLSAFDGPLVSGGHLERLEDAGRLNDFYLYAGGIDSSADYISFGGCSLYDQMLHFGADRENTSYGAYCNGYPEWIGGRPQVAVDGQPAVEPYWAHNVASGDPSTRPELGLDVVHDPATGDVTIDEIVPIAFCTTDACQPAGVELHRRTLHREDGRLTVQQDAWRSTDGSAHQVEVPMMEDFCWGGGCEGGEILFPGATEFVPWPTGTTEVDGPGPLSLITRGVSATDDENPARPQAGVTFATAPGPLEFDHRTFRRRLVIAVPATGAAYDARVYTNSAGRAGAEESVEAAEALLRPAVTLEAPESTTSARLTLRGSVTVDRGTPSVVVNGTPAAVDGDSWSLDVTLQEGANAFEVVATNAYGHTASASRTVTYRRPADSGGGVTPPPPPPPVDPAAVAQGLLGVPVRLLPGADFGEAAKLFARASAVRARRLSFVRSKRRLERLAVFCPVACTVSGSARLTYRPRAGARASASRLRSFKLRVASVAVPAGEARPLRVAAPKRARRALRRVRSGRLRLALTVVTAAARETDRVAARVRIR